MLILITFLFVFKPADKNFQFYISTVSETITCITFALVALCILAFVFIRDKQDKMEYSFLILHALFVVPLVWQLAMIFNSNICTSYDGYTYWIPVVKFAMQHLQNQKVLVHCARNKRVSCFVFLYRMLRLSSPLEPSLADLQKIWQPDSIWQGFIDAALSTPSS